MPVQSNALRVEQWSILSQTAKTWKYFRAVARHQQNKLRYVQKDLTIVNPRYGIRQFMESIAPSWAMTLLWASSWPPVMIRYNQEPPTLLCTRKCSASNCSRSLSINKYIKKCMPRTLALSSTIVSLAFGTNLMLLLQRFSKASVKNLRLFVSKPKHAESRPLTLQA